MKNSFLFLCLMGISITLPLSSDAQILNKIKRAAQQGVENAVERRVTMEVENAAQRQMQKYLEGIFGPAPEGDGMDYGSIMKGVNMNVEVADSYSFKGYTDMEITGTDKKGKSIDPMRMKSLLSEDSGLWAIEMASPDKDMEKTTMIYDDEHKASVLLMENKKGEKYHMAYGIDWEKMMGQAEAHDDEATLDENHPDIVKTGNTKTINGYLCEEYKSETDEYVSHVWVTQEPIEGFSTFWSQNNPMISKRMQQQGNTSWEQMPQGNLMEMHHQSKTDKSSSVLKVVELNSQQEFEFQMSDYPNAMTAKQ